MLVSEQSATLIQLSPRSADPVPINNHDETTLWYGMIITLNSFHAGTDLSHLLITFANSLDSDHDCQTIGPDLGPNCLTLL